MITAAQSWFLRCHSLSSLLRIFDFNDGNSKDNAIPQISDMIGECGRIAVLQVARSLKHFSHSLHFS